MDGLLDEVGCFGHLACPQVFDDCRGLLVGGLAALLGMNGLEYLTSRTLVERTWLKSCDRNAPCSVGSARLGDGRRWRS